MAVAFHFEPPVVMALFPSFVVVCWERPRALTKFAFAEHASWEYVIEYCCSCHMRHQPYAKSTMDTYALLATAHQGETFYVRLVARASFAGSMAGLVSSKTTIVAKSNMTMPWSAASPSLCIFDGLYLCATNTWASPAAALSVMNDRRRSAAQPEHRCVLSESFAVCVLEGDIEFRLHRATYEEPVPPSNKRIIYYMVATGRRNRAGQRMRDKDVESILRRDDATLVFCGVGDGGALALKSAHALLSSFITSCPALCRLVFCITYGTPRAFLKDGPQLLAHTLPHSYQFLHVTQLPLKDGGVAGSVAWDGTLVSQRWAGGRRDALSPQLHTGYVDGFYENVLLGVQCSIAHRGRGCGHGLLFHASSPLLPLTQAEENEVFDVEAQLQRLAHILMPGLPSLLAPAITSLRCRSEGPFLHLTVDGINLQFCPRLTLLPPQRAALFPCVTACAPHQLMCVGSLLPWIEACASASGEDDINAVVDCQKKGLDVPLCVLLQTSCGTCATCPGAVVASLPRHLVELYRFAAQETPWAKAAPSQLLEAALQTQPLYMLCQSSPSSALTDATLNPMAAVLCSLASAAETALAEKMRSGVAASSAAASVFGFISDMAARFSSAVTSVSAGGAVKLIVEEKEASFLKNALREWAGNASAEIDVWRRRSASWKQRIEYALPSLGDKRYRETLLRMLGCFESHVRDDSVREKVPYLWLEARLHAHVRLYVSQQQQQSLFSGTSAEELLCARMTLNDFYAAVADIFTSRSAASSAVSAPLLACVEDVMTLWCICQCFELRQEMSRTLLCCVVGCAGCGGSTLSNTLSTLLQSNHAFAYPPSTLRRRVPTCLLAPSRFPALFMATQSDVRLSVFLAGEVGDLARAPYASMSVLTQEHLTSPHQHWFRVITKADEHLCRSHALQEALEVQSVSATSVLDEVSAAVLDSSGIADEQRLSVSLAPSPSLISQTFSCSHEEARVLASELRAASQEALLRCLLYSIGQGHAAAPPS
jgi:hypothetical protein